MPRSEGSTGGDWPIPSCKSGGEATARAHFEEISDVRMIKLGDAFRTLLLGKYAVHLILPFVPSPFRCEEEALLIKLGRPRSLRLGTGKR